MVKQEFLLINLGTPDSTSWWDIRRYLKEFLSDRRVIEVNPIIMADNTSIYLYLHLGHQKQLMHIKKFGEKKQTSPRCFILQRNQAENLNSKIGK